MLLDLDGFKGYNDTFGHMAGDAMLRRLGGKLAAAVEGHGAAYRLGGDEFCTLLKAGRPDLETLLAATAGALLERGENFAVSASYGAVLLPHEAENIDFALQLADERMYECKRDRPSRSPDHTSEILRRIMTAHHPALEARSGEVAALARRLGLRMGVSGEQLDELIRAAELQDIGRVGIPDEILNKASPLSDEEWLFMRQHTLLAERILSAAPALRPVAAIVRSTPERWDGRGYPDGLLGEQSPLGSRILGACVAYHAMTTERSYRPRLNPGQAREELRREAGRQFDPAVVGALLAELDEDSPAEPLPEAGTLEHDLLTASEIASRMRAMLAEEPAEGTGHSRRPGPADR
jgi:diguanylate cyclase (GGDEF)-like protein